ncbi:MAG: hypothetical protein H0X38_08500 [Planctomycetes bacterium]|nr:hypothetical protein [Planctomycetota bacterium]
MSGDPSRQGGLGGRPRPRPTETERIRRGETRPADVPDVGVEAAVEDPTSTLVQALDRLRATDAVRPADDAMVRMLRGMRHYQEESRHGLPVIGDGAESMTMPPIAPV